MAVELLNRESLIARYAAGSNVPAESVAERLWQQEMDYQPDGWMLLQCAYLSGAAHAGELSILPYGPKNTYKEIPETPISPRGLASDMSVVIAVCLCIPEDIPDADGT